MLIRRCGSHPERGCAPKKVTKNATVWLGWLLFFLFGGDALTLKAIEEDVNILKYLVE
jgi:hypothetical protein